MLTINVITLPARTSPVANEIVASADQENDQGVARRGEEAPRPAPMVAGRHHIRAGFDQASGGVFFAQAFRRALHPGENRIRFQLRHLREKRRKVNGPVRRFRERSWDGQLWQVVHDRRLSAAPPRHETITAGVVAEPGLCTPFPVPDLRQVLTILVDVAFVFDQLVAELLLEIDAAFAGGGRSRLPAALQRHEHVDHFDPGLENFRPRGPPFQRRRIARPCLGVSAIPRT